MSDKDEANIIAPMSDSHTDNPPRGDFETAEKYINQLIDLLNDRKIEVDHTDLKRFDPTTLQDHYTISLSEYQIEISHSKQPDSGKDSYVMIFNNMKQIAEGSGAKVILAYIYLADSQFSKFKIVADHYIAEKRRVEEERRFKEALEPIDQLLNEASESNTKSIEKIPAAAHSALDYNGFESAKTDNPLMSNLERELDSALDQPEDANRTSYTALHQV